jgi:hypothetical protein
MKDVSRQESAGGQRSSLRNVETLVHIFAERFRSFDDDVSGTEVNLNSTRKVLCNASDVRC